MKLKRPKGKEPENKIVWKRQTQQYQNGWNGFVGKYIFFTVVWDGMTSQDSEYKHKLSGFLPGINIFRKFKKPKDAEKYAEKVLTYWLEQTNLIHKEI